MVDPKASHSPERWVVTSASPEHLSLLSGPVTEVFVHCAPNLSPALRQAWRETAEGKLWSFPVGTGLWLD